jgi:hypothetical protein
MKQLKLEQWDKVLYRQITTMHSEGKPPKLGLSVYGEIKLISTHSLRAAGKNYPQQLRSV